MAAHPKYTGANRKIVLCFDVGMTFSGISYSILEPGEIPEIKSVTRASRIPTVIYYDQEGKIKAIGSEALKDGIERTAHEENWSKAEWFKVHLLPSSGSTPVIPHKILPLPKNKTAVDVFADFLRYLSTCAQGYIEETHIDGINLWASLNDQANFVITHPNGWEGTPKVQMRKAAINAGLVLDTRNGHSRVHFVTEGEAGLHFCIQTGLTTEALKRGHGVLIIDAGGGTIDISAYSQPSATSPSFQKIGTPLYLFRGSTFVTNLARTFLEDLLQDSQFANATERITQCFDKSTKLNFKDSSEPQYIRFGTLLDKDIRVGIQFGQLRLDGKDVAKFFEPSIQCIVECVVTQRNNSSIPINSVFLVGGFALNEWLFTQVRDALQIIQVDCFRPENSMSRAVAEGGVSFYINYIAAARLANFHCGISIHTHYDVNNAEHKKRSLTVKRNSAGFEYVPNGFDIILPKNTKVLETTKFCSVYTRSVKSFKKLPDKIRVTILCYRGPQQQPRWTDEDPGMYTKLCTVTADVRALKNASSRPLLGRNSVAYYKISYNVCLKFGPTEFTAQICWDLEGKRTWSPAKIIYEYDIPGSGADEDEP